MLSFRDAYYTFYLLATRAVIRLVIKGSNDHCLALAILLTKQNEGCWSLVFQLFSITFWLTTQPKRGNRRAGARSTREHGAHRETKRDFAFSCCCLTLKLKLRKEFSQSARPVADLQQRKHSFLCFSLLWGGFLEILRVYQIRRTTKRRYAEWRTKCFSAKFALLHVFAGLLMRMEFSVRIPAEASVLFKKNKNVVRFLLSEEHTLGTFTRQVFPILFANFISVLPFL